MKSILTTLLILTWMVGAGQTIQELHKQYNDYCNEVVIDTIEEYGEVEATKEVPIYDGCDQIIGYRSIPAKDTTWKGYKCPEWKTVYTAHFGIGIDSLSTFSTQFQREYVYSIQDGTLKRTLWPGSCKVSRKHACQVKREKPSQEGFYTWLYNQIKMGGSK